MDLKSATVLIVDDQIASICLLQNILSRIGYTKVEGITDAREIIPAMERLQPDLIILDVHMPNLDGFHALQALGKVIPRDSFLPVLVLTGDSTGRTKRRALAAGASDLLHKPFNTSEAFVRIENLLRMRMLHLQLQDHNRLLAVKVAERTEELRVIQRQVVAQERLSAFGEMASGVVHDFNNALMSVIGYSEILLQDPRIAGQRRHRSRLSKGHQHVGS